MTGYSALAQRDESLALRVLEEHNALVRSVLRQYRGREVKTMGDAFLLEFESALEAVLCAIEIQSHLCQRNRSSADLERFKIRIGIHLGDVVHRENDILGDTVNIASRIVNQALPGRICVSEQAYYQIRNKINYPLVKMPAQKLKNIDLETDLYQILLPWQDERDNRRDDVDAPLGSGTSSLPTSFKNRIAIIPFVNISPDPSESYFADGMTEELITALSEIKGLRVIAKTSVNRYKGSSKSAKEIGSELQVPYVIEGSIRKAGNKIRIAAQLIDVESQETTWSGRYDRELDDVFAIQSDIARRVADSLRVTLMAGESARIERKDTKSLTAYAAYLKGRSLLQSRTERAIKDAKAQFEFAISHDPAFARAYSGMADIHILLGDYLFAPAPSSLEEAKTYIKKALELDPSLAEAHVSLAESLLYDFKFLESEEEFKRAIALNPSYATAHHWYANCLEQFGREQDAFAELILAEELDPLSSAITMSMIYACLDLGKYDEALQKVQKLSEIDPESPFVDEAYMVHHFARGEWEESMKYLNKMRNLDPTDPYLQADEAYIHAVTGDTRESMRIVEDELKNAPETSGVKCTLMAFVFAGLDNLDQCFYWLEKAVDNREVFFGWFRLYKRLANVRSDPRFDELLRRAGLSAALPSQEIVEQD